MESVQKIKDSILRIILFWRKPKPEELLLDAFKQSHKTWVKEGLIDKAN